MRIRRTDLSKDHAGLGENEKKGVLQRNKNQGKYFNLLNLSKAQCLVPFHFLDEDATRSIYFENRRAPVQ